MLSTLSCSKRTSLCNWVNDKSLVSSVSNDFNTSSPVFRFTVLSDGRFAGGTINSAVFSESSKRGGLGIRGRATRTDTPTEAAP